MSCRRAVTAPVTARKSDTETNFEPPTADLKTASALRDADARVEQTPSEHQAGTTYREPHCPGSATKYAPANAPSGQSNCAWWANSA